MSHTRDELSTFSLQKLASIYPQTKEEDEILQEIFEKRASVSNYFTLTSLVDVKHKWQEDILQKYIDIKRETMAPENPVSLTPADEAKLDSNVVTKETELELQAKLDKHNKKKTESSKGSQEEPLTEEEAVEELGAETVEEIKETAEEVAPEVVEETSTETPKEKKPRKPRAKK